MFISIKLRDTPGKKKTSCWLTTFLTSEIQTLTLQITRLLEVEQQLDSCLQVLDVKGDGKLEHKMVSKIGMLQQPISLSGIT